MKTIIHDLKDNDLNFSKDDYIVDSTLCNNSCIGCFSCWIKHPKKCIYSDNYSNMADKIKESDELIIISKSRFGCYSEEIKRVLERCIGYVLPYFKVRNKMIHHKPRYDHNLKIKAFFYGDINQNDQKCLYDLVKANSINLNANNFEVNFFKNTKEIKDAYFN